MWTRHLISLVFLISVISYGYARQAGPEVENKTELEKLGNNIQASLENNNPSYFNSLLDIETIIERTIAASGTSENNSFYEGFSDGFINSFDLGQALINELGTQGTYQFLHAVQRNSEIHLIFRILSPAGLNYHDMCVERKDQSFSITEVYNFYTDESISDIVKRMYNLVDPSKGTASDTWKNWQSYLLLHKFMQKEKYGKVLKKWEKQPDELRLTKKNLSLALRASSLIDENKFNPVFEEFITNYPENGSKYLQILDALSYQTGYSNEILMFADSLETYLISDPFIDFLRADTYHKMNNEDMAIQKLEELVIEMPKYEVPYISLLNILLEQKKYADAASLLQRIEYTFSSYKEDLKPLLTDYPEFLKSEEYLSWLEQ